MNYLHIPEMKMKFSNLYMNSVPDFYNACLSQVDIILFAPLDPVVVFSSGAMPVKWTLQVNLDKMV